MAKKGKKGGTNGGSKETSMVIYRGPIQVSSQQPQNYRITMKTSGTVTSNSAGYIELYCNTASVPTFSEWSSIAPLWREYRVLGIRLDYVSCYDKSGSNRTNYPGAIAPYHGAPPAWQGAVTSSSFANTWLMEGAKPWHPGVNFTLEWRMADIEEAQFLSTSSSYNLGGIYGTTAGTLSASVAFGVAFYTYLIEFKGRV